MRKYRFLKGLITGLAIGVSGTFIYHWDARAIGAYVKYKLGEHPQYGAVDTRQVQPEKLWKIVCISTEEKDCPQPHKLPLPGTLWLVGAGLVGLWKLKRNG